MGKFYEYSRDVTCALRVSALLLKAIHMYSFMLDKQTVQNLTYHDESSLLGPLSEVAEGGGNTPVPRVVLM